MNEVMAQLPSSSKTRFCATLVPMSSEIERMGLTREPVACFAPRSAGSLAFEALWDELSGDLLQK